MDLSKPIRFFFFANILRYGMPNLFGIWLRSILPVFPDSFQNPSSCPLSAYGSIRFRYSKFIHPSGFGKNCFLDNTTDIRYLNPGNQSPQDVSTVISEIHNET